MNCPRVSDPLRVSLLAALLASAFASAGFAQTATTWISTGDTDFANSVNWDTGAPVDDTTSSLATFDGTGTASPVLTATQSVAGVSYLAGGYTLSASGGGGLTLGTAGLSNDFGANTVSLSLAGAGGVSQNGGTLTLTGANTYTGGTAVSSGTLSIGNATAIGTGTLAITGGTTLSNSSGAALTLTNNNAQTWVGNPTISPTASGMNLGTGAVTLLGNTLLTTNTGSTTVGGAIGDGGNGYKLTKIGTGTLILSGANTFSGGVTLSAGTLGIGNAAALGTGPVTVSAAATISNTSGGSLTLTTNNPVTLGATLTFASSNSLNLGTGGVALGSATRNIAVTNAATTLTIPGNITQTSTAALVKGGTGTLVLSGTNSYTGLTVVSGGTLQFAQTSALYGDSTASWTPAKITVTGSGTLSLNVGGTGEFATGDVTTLLTNLSTVSSNGLEQGSKIGFDTTHASGGTFTIADNIANSTGTAGGAVGLTKLGTGTLVLSGTNTYTGPTLVSAGTLSVNGSLASGSVVTVSSGATLGGTGTVSGALILSSGGLLSAGSGGAGTLSIGGGLTLNGGSGTIFVMDLTKDASGTAGVSWDKLSITGALNASALSSSSQLTIDLVGSTGVFDPSVNHTWASFIAATSITGFNPNGFNVDATGLGTLNGGTFAVVQDGNSLDLQFLAAIPEPATMTMLAGFAALSLAFVVRQRRTAR
jgi:autotransporter-associated beta strand protein